MTDDKMEEDLLANLLNKDFLGDLDRAINDGSPNETDA